MLVQLFFLLPVSFSEERNFIQTKHMSGGVFNWHKSLLSQRNLWSSLPLPVKFYKTDINLPKLVRHKIEDLLPDVNISDFFNGLFEDFGKDESDSKFSSKSTLKDFINLNLNLFNHRFLNEEEEGDGSDYIEKCKNKNLKNIDLLGGSIAFIGESLNISCEELDELIGQLFSLAFILIPIIVMWVVVTIFYIFYCYGCCCCCRAKDRYNPGIVSIVFFVIIASFLIIALGFNIAASVYLFNLLSYVLKGDAFKDINYSLNYAKPTLISIATNFQNNLNDSLRDTTNSIGSTIDSSVQKIIDNIKNGVNKLNDLQQVFELADSIESTERSNAEGARDKFLNCNSEKNDPDCNYIIDQVKTNLLDKIDLETITTITSKVGEVESFVTQISESVEDMEGIREVKNELMNVFTDLSSQITEADLPGKVNELNISEISSYIEKYEDGVPYKQFHHVLYTTCFLFPMFMVILTSLEIMAFWLKNCCSRCIVCYCCPRCICSCCLLFVGFFCTFAAFMLIFIDIMYDQGDDLFDLALKKLLNENRTIEFGSINSSELSRGMLPALEIKSFTIDKPKLIKTFVDAKLNSKFSEFIPILDFFQLDQIANSLNDSFSSAQLNVNILTEPINEIFDNVNEYTNIIDFDDLSIGNVNDVFTDDKYSPLINDKCESVPNCLNKNNNFENVKNEYGNLLSKLNQLQEKGKNSLKPTQDAIKSINNNIGPDVQDLVSSLLFKVGGAFSDIINTIEPSIDENNIDWMISLFNIIRVKGCRQLVGAAMSFSISAHLFLVGYAAMTILLCCRRKGMGEISKERAAPSFSYSEYSYSQQELKEKKKKKKKGHNYSSEENTSGNALVEFQSDQNNSDAEKRDISESEKYSDELSNYANPYQHDDSSISYQINDESTNQQSESFQPRVSENENESSVQNNNLSFDDDESTTDNKENNIANIIKDIKDQNESESEPAKISETEDNDESSNYPNNNDINFHDDESSGNNSDIDDGDQQTYVF